MLTSRPVRVALALSALCASSVLAQQPDSAQSQAGGTSAGAIGQKLANPLTDIWALFTENDLVFFKGDATGGDSKVGGRIIAEPIMSFPLYGEKDKRWMLSTRPQFPVLIRQPIPIGNFDVKHISGVGDLRLPLLLKPPTGNFLFALGPDLLIPTGSRREFTGQQFGLGPGLVVGQIFPKLVVVSLLQYYWGLGGWNGPNTPDVNLGSFLYLIEYSLPNAWAIGTSPTITFDKNAPKDNKWNVPFGLEVSKTTFLGKLPVKLQLGANYSVVSEDLFGQRWQITLNVIPVIPAMLTRPLFGGAHNAAVAGAP